MQDKKRIAQLTSDVVAAYVEHNSIPAAELPNVVQLVYGALAGIAEKREAPAVEEGPRPAVPIRRSVTDDYIVCLEDGLRFKSLKRHLMTRHGMSPAQYRERWNLPADYPTVAPNYAKSRSALAKQMGLGRTGLRR